MRADDDLGKWEWVAAAIGLLVTVGYAIYCIVFLFVADY